MKTSDVIVIGGGAVGCAVAYFLAREGVSVTLLERDDLAAHASGAAAGMLAPICESEGHGPFFELCLRSLRMMPAILEELRERSGTDPQYVPSGILRVATSDREAEQLRPQAARLSAFDVEWLDAENVRSREPRITGEARGALWSSQEGHVYSPYLTRAYAEAAVRLGARIECGVPVVGLRREGERVTGVHTPDGVRAAGHVVLCAGAWTRFCAPWFGAELPVEPVRGQILALEAPAPTLPCIVWDEGAYLVPKRDGTIVVGATEERVGFDCRTTARGLGGLLDAAARLVPALGECAFRRAWAGLRPDTPDHLPVIGPIPGVDGLILAAGHFRNGVLLSPATGELVTNWLLRSEIPSLARSFLPERLLRQSS